MSFKNNLINPNLNSEINTIYTNIDNYYYSGDTSYNTLTNISDNLDVTGIASDLMDDTTETPYIKNEKNLKTKISNTANKFKRIDYSGGVTNDFLFHMDASYDIIKEKINIYDDKREELKEKLLTYNNTTGRLSDAKSNKYYILFIVWLVIFFIIMFTVFSNIVEEQKTMNLPTKILVFLFIAFIFYFILKNTFMYFSGYT